VFGAIVPMIQSYCKVTTYFSIASVGSVINYVGYFFLGFLLRDYKVGKLGSILLLLLFLFGFFLTAYGTYYITVIKNKGVFVDFFYNYLSVNVLVMSISMFVLAKSTHIFDWLNNHPLSNQLVATIASAVPGIYFVHALVLAILKQGLLGITINETMYGPAIGIPLFALILFIISLMIVMLIRNIPVLKRIVS
jgi:surface polysaccharide O-acyltransferase-like enzyme